MESKPALWLLIALILGGPPSLADIENEGTSTLTLRSKRSPKLRPWLGEWKLEVGGGNFDEGKDEGLVTYVELTTHFNYRFTSWMHLVAAPSLELTASRVQSRSLDNDLGGNRIRFRDLYLSLAPVRFFELRAGAIGQHFLGMPMLVSRRAFPGFAEFLKGEYAGVHATLAAQQVVPTSYTMGSERADKEPLPSFQTQSLTIKGARKDWLSTTATAGHFTWAYVPSKVAFESALTGNNVQGEVAPGAQFLYGFDGYFWGTEVGLGPSRYMQMILEYQGINNSASPSHAGRAELVGIGPRFLVSGVEVDLRYRRYFVESDATVSSYNYYRLGHTNRIGDWVKLNVDFKAQKFSVFAQWFNARTINDSSTQFTMNNIFVGVETHYVEF